MNNRIALLAGGLVGYGIYKEMIDRGKPPVVLVLADINREHRNDDCYGITNTDVTTVITDSQIDELLNYDLDLGICAWWDIIPQHIVKSPKNGFINTHPSYLPFNKGKDPHFWSIVEQTKFGVTLNAISDEVDSGDILFRSEIYTGWTDTGKTLDEKAKHGLIKLFKESFTCIYEGEFNSIPQHERTHIHKRSELHSASELVLDKSYTGRELLNIIRARSHSPGAWFTDNGKIYSVSCVISENDSNGKNTPS